MLSNIELGNGVRRGRGEERGERTGRHRTQCQHVLDNSPTLSSRAARRTAARAQRASGIRVCPIAEALQIDSSRSKPFK